MLLQIPNVFTADEPAHCRMLFDLDMSIRALGEKHGDAAGSVKRTGCDHNLMRMWAEA